MKRVYKSVCILSACGLLTGSAVYTVYNGQIPEVSGKEEKTKTSVSASQIVRETEKALISGTEIQQLTVKEHGVTEITSSGIYRITGTAADCQISVDTKGTAVLILDGADLSNEKDAVINVIDAEHVLIYTAEGTDNSITSGMEQEIAPLELEAEGAAIYSKEDLTFAGDGILHIGGYINNGAASTDQLTVVSGTLDIKAMNNGLKGKDSLTIEDGDITVLSGNDGLKSSNDEDEGMGNVLILGGTFSIQSYGDCITAVSDLTVENGSFTLSTAGYEAGISDSSSFQGFDFNGSMPDPDNLPEEMKLPENGDMQFPNGDMTPPDGAQMPQGGMQFPGGGDMTPPEGMEMPPNGMERPEGGMPYGGGRPGQQDSSSSSTSSIQLMSYTAVSQDTNDERGGFGGGFPGGGGGFGGPMDGNSNKSDESQKGLKSDGTLTVNGGTFKIETKDDAVHANGDVTISGGSFVINTDDDGLHSDTVMTINDGTVKVESSYEGIEGHQIYVNGGVVEVTASDDGFNASGSGNCLLEINGGNIYVNASGDGLDSNGDLIVNDGFIVVEGPTNSGNGALDSGSENGGVIEVHGGELIAIGATGMDETFDGTSSQCTIRAVTSSCSAGTLIEIKDEDGTVLYSITSSKSFSSIVYTSAALQTGSTYTVTAGDQSYEITIQGKNGSNSSTGSFGMPGGFGGWGGGRPGGK